MESLLQTREDRSVHPEQPPPRVAYRPERKGRPMEPTNTRQHCRNRQNPDTANVPKRYIMQLIPHPECTRTRSSQATSKELWEPFRSATARNWRPHRRHVENRRTAGARQLDACCIDRECRTLEGCSVAAAAATAAADAERGAAVILRGNRMHPAEASRTVEDP